MRTQLSLFVAIVAVATLPWAPPAADAGNRSRGHAGSHPEWVEYSPRRQGPPPWASAHGHRRRPVSVRYVAVSHVPARADREFLGVLLGGATGGLLGTNLGQGHGRTAAVIGGTVLGALVGGSVGRAMDVIDRRHLGDTLEYAPTGTVATWRNPDHQAAYQLTPVATFQDREGRYCREYTATATVAGEHQQVYGTACRQPDGSWEIVR